MSISWGRTDIITKKIANTASVTITASLDSDEYNAAADFSDEFMFFLDDIFGEKVEVKYLGGNRIVIEYETKWTAQVQDNASIYAQRASQRLDEFMDKAAELYEDADYLGDDYYNSQTRDMDDDEDPEDAWYNAHYRHS